VNPLPEPATFRWDGAKFSPCREIAIADRGFRYGMMVFETIAVRPGRALFLEEHLERLKDAARQTGLFLSPGIEAVADFLTKSDLHGIARLHLTAGPGVFDAPASAGELLLTIESRDPKLPDAYRLDDRPHVVLPPWPGLKTGNYWPNIRALGEARRAGFDEVVLVNPEGHVISAAMANLFLVRAGKISAPPPSTGARRGVIRDWVVSRHPVREVAMTESDLAEAEEIFLTSSGLGIMPVSHFGPRPLAHAVSSMLRTEYETPESGFGGDVEADTQDACAPRKP